MPHDGTHFGAEILAQGWREFRQRQGLPASSPPLFWRASEVAAVTRLGRTTIDRMAQKGFLRRFGGPRTGRFHRDDIVKFLDGSMQSERNAHS